jgi:FkbM family methyltransferase
MARRMAFVLAASDQGALIVNRMDHATDAAGNLYGVGSQILDRGAYDPAEVDLLLRLLARRRFGWGDGVVALDCGANIGVHTVAWAKAMAGWGEVIAIEAQERIFYALAGNIVLNNCFNARAFHAAVGAVDGGMRVPVPDYQSAGSFGSLELRRGPNTENIGQRIDYSDSAMVEIRCTTIDSFGLRRLDVLKIDVEGMEADVLDGAARTLARLRPTIVAEHIKVGWQALADRLLPLGYTLTRTPMNMIAIPAEAPHAGV